MPFQSQTGIVKVDQLLNQGYQELKLQEFTQNNLLIGENMLIYQN